MRLRNCLYSGCVKWCGFGREAGSHGLWRLGPYPLRHRSLLCVPYENSQRQTDRMDADGESDAIQVCCADRKVTLSPGVYDGVTLSLPMNWIRVCGSCRENMLSNSYID